MPEDLFAHLMLVSRRLVKAVKITFRPKGYSIMQNGGKYNDIGHYHLHVFPRHDGDGFGWTASKEPKTYSKEIADSIKANLWIIVITIFRWIAATILLKHPVKGGDAFKTGLIGYFCNIHSGIH